MDLVIEKRYSEQSIIANLKLLRVISQNFKNVVRPSFTRKDLERAVEGYELV